MSQSSAPRHVIVIAAVAAACAVALAVPSAQQTSIKKSYPIVRDMRGVVPPGPRVAPYNSPPLGDGPWQFESYEQRTIKVSVVTKGLSHPWSVAFLPDGSMLVTERPGRLRIIRDGALDPQTIAGLPQVQDGGTSGLMDIALHPNFLTNRLVYFTYIKSGKRPDGSSGYWATTVLSRARFDGNALSEVREIFAAEPYGTLPGGD